MSKTKGGGSTRNGRDSNAQRLGVKFAPRLQFRPDESFDEARRMESLLDDPKVRRDLDGE